MMLQMRIFNWVYAKLFSVVFSRRFGSFGRGVRIISPVAIEGAHNIYIDRKSVV